jgi:hypothetical protein
VEKIGDKYIFKDGGRIKHLEYFRGTEYIPGNTRIVQGYTGEETERTSFIIPIVGRIKVQK